MYIHEYPKTPSFYLGFSLKNRRAHYKPKNYITTLADEKGRPTVIDLLKGAFKERLYPVGRLDRLTTGVILITNDGELSQKLCHPKFEVKKVYSVVLDQPIAYEDIVKLIVEYDKVIVW